MATKDIKSALKSAKEKLDEKDYKSAVKQCRNVLALDQNNYLALVFYGAAVQETEHKNEAPKAFKKAIEISPKQILAWRGLACYYEKNNEECESKELLEIYKQMVALETDSAKFSMAIEKLQKLSMSLGDTSTLKLMSDLLPKAEDDEKKLLIHQYIVSVFDSKQSDFILEYENSVQYLLSIKPHLSNYLDLLKQYLLHLYKHNNFETVISVGCKALESYPEDQVLLECICKAYAKSPVEKIPENFSAEDVYTKLIQILPDSYLGYFCKGIHELYKLDLLNANEALKHAAKLQSNSGLIWLKLSSCELLLFQFSNAEENSSKALKCFESSTHDENLILSCEINLLHSLCEHENEIKLSQAKKLGIKLHEKNPSNVEILEYLTKSLIKLHKFMEANECIEKINQFEKYKHIANYLKCLSLKYEDKMKACQENLEKLVVEAPNYFASWLELGIIYFYQSNGSPSLNCLLKAAKLNQWCYLNFLYLGHCYLKMVGDLEKARRCYQKAFQLNPTSAEVGSHLSNIYRILGKEDLNLQLLLTATVLNSKCKWAWLKLGLHYLSVNQSQDAVNSLQIAVRLDPEDNTAWECLGDAYFSLGAHTSAIKSYEKTLQLHSNSVYPMFQIAKIKHLIGQFSESVEEFRIVNSNISNYIPALKGHAEACLSLMRQYLSQNLNGLAQDACQEAVLYLTKCLELQKDLICIWKLLGDSCTLLSILQEKYCTLKVAAWLFTGSKSQDEEIVLNKLQILKFGSRCYCQAISINSNFSDLWYDLAYVYNCMVNVSKTEESRKQMRKLACAAVKKSILLNEEAWYSWNLYGIILASKEFKNYFLAQHCFIKAIQKQNTNAVTWTNLGTLYLNLNDLQLANQCFTEAQKLDHDYVFCWVGQAIIAQKTGHHDATDLFRHSTQLAFTSEGSLRYSNSICQTLLNTKNKSDKNYIYTIENMNAVTVAIDVLTWYTDRFPYNFWAFNMLGLLLERRMLYKSSAKAFKESLELAEAEKLKEKREDLSEIINKILLNYGRVLSKLNLYEEALTHLKRITKAEFTNQCELAATYFKAKLYEDAYSSYETTLEWLAPDTEMKSHILVAMAAVVYLHQGQEDAKILLMQSCQLKPASVQGLFACCALGMLHSDLALSELALKELKSFKDDPRYLNHIAVFQAYIYLFKGQKEKAIRALNEIIHRHPGQPSLWLSLSLLLLHMHTTFGSKSAAVCAEIALVTGRSSIDVSKVMSLVSLSNLLCGEGLKSLKSSQKAVHMFPDVTENWVVLVASVLSKCLVQESVEEISWLKKMITYIRRKFESSKTMTQWLSNNNRKIALMADKVVS